MKEIVTFSKEIDFKTMVHKITGISLEHTLKLTSPLLIEGEFLISGTYKMTGASQIEEDFYYKIPVDIEVDEKYNTENLEIDIYDFTYEILNEETLKLAIDLSLSNLELKENFEDLKNKEDIIEELQEEIGTPEEEFTLRDNKDLFKEIETKEKLIIPETKKKEEPMEKEENNVSVDSIFMAFQDTPETYSTYRVYIVRANDTIDEILNKYKLTREQLEEYNNLGNITVGTKLIIPNTNE